MGHSCSVKKVIWNLKSRKLTLCRRDDIGLDLFHPLALLLGVCATANVCLFYLFGFLEVDVHFFEGVLGRVLDVLQNGLQFPRVLLVEQLSLLCHCIRGFDSESIVGSGVDNQVVGVVLGIILSGQVELVGVRRETFVIAHLTRRCHANAALVCAAASQRTIVTTAILVVVEVHTCRLL